MAAVAAGITAAAGRRASTGTALLTALIAWLMLNGFIANGLGELRWHGRADLVRLLVLAAAAMAAQAVRALRGPR